jgi:4-amino-4-deoxy-L-arabinose transferase-like glycosyltransferase
MSVHTMPDTSFRWKWTVPSYVILLFVVLVATYVRLNHLSMPFERDEGEYAYAARLILQGIPPFQEVYNMKMPGIYFTYAVLMAFFGETVEGVRLGLVFANLLTAIILYLMFSRLYPSFVACVATGSFLILSLTPKLQGISANAEHFVILPALVGIYFLILSIHRKRAWLSFLSGIMLGTAFVIKQHGLAFVLFGFLYLAYGLATESDGRTGRIILTLFCFGLACLLPFLCVLVLILSHGVFDRFWFWTFVYAGHYMTMTAFLKGFQWLRLLMSHLVSSAPIPWILCFAGLISLLSYRSSPQQKTFALGFLLFSFVAVSPGFYYRPHYFIMLLPAISLLGGIALEHLRQAFQGSLHPRWRGIGGVAALFLLFISLGHSIYLNRDAFFSMSSAQLLRSSYGMNPFLEAVEIARFIEARSRPEERIAVVGSEPEIYFYAKRRAATGYMYTYPLTENHPYAERMQREMISQIEGAMPRFLVLVGNPFSWSVTPASPQVIFEWLNRFVMEHYTLVCTADTFSGGRTIYARDEEAMKYKKGSQFWIDVFERKKKL